MTDKTHSCIGEQGFVLPTVLVALSLLTLLAFASSDTALLQQKMAFNMKQRTRAIEAAAIALRHAENRLLQQVSASCTCSALQADPDKPPALACHEQLARRITLVSPHAASTEPYETDRTSSSAWQKLSDPAHTETVHYKMAPLLPDEQSETDDPEVLLLFRLTAQALERQARATVQSQYQITFQYCSEQPPQGRRFAWHEVRL